MGDLFGGSQPTYFRFQKIAPRVRNSRKIIKNLANFARKIANFDENFEIRDHFSPVDSKPVQRSASCRSWRELSNAYFVAKFDFDTAENEPSEVPHPG